MPQNYSINSPQDDEEGVRGGEGHQDGEDRGDTSGNDCEYQGAAEKNFQVKDHFIRSQMAVQSPT